MSKRKENARQARRHLAPLAIVACLLMAAAPPLLAGGSSSHHHGVRKAGLHVSLGVHGHHGYRHHGYRGHFRGYHRSYRPFVFRPYGYYPYRYYPRVHYHGYYGVPRHASRFGGLDLNVKPKKTTQVYIDGNYVGHTGNFDGWPDHLWLEASRSPASRGTNHYELILYNPGYKTVVRNVELQPGVVIKIHEDMQPGESIPPEELSTAKARPRPSPQTREQAPLEPAPEPMARAAPSPRVGPGTTSRPDVLDARQQPARLKLSVAPADASVYLDGQFLGIAGEIGEQRSGVLVDPGEHRLEIVRPGYDNRELRFDADAGGEVKLDIELQSGASKAGWSA